MATVAILLVDDHPLFRDGFAGMARALRPCWRLAFASSAGEGLAQIEGGAGFDVAILDIVLPDGDGFALHAAIAAAAPALPVILISGREDAATRLRARRAGARGFIAKAAPAETIVALVDAVLAGGVAFSPIVDPAPLPSLTARQRDVLALLAEGHGNKEIRHRLGIAERTVRAHLTDLFGLLGAHSRIQAILRARELGLIG